MLVAVEFAISSTTGINKGSTIFISVMSLLIIRVIHCTSLEPGWLKLHSRLPHNSKTSHFSPATTIQTTLLSSHIYKRAIYVTLGH